MPLHAGSRLGPYEIVEPIGAGGMGEVYRATDTNLRRQVAIKVLPESLAGDADRLARFQREAEVLAALNHPNIAHLYGLERTSGATALVMELVEGPTLADRLASASANGGGAPRALSLEDALPIARQIAEALEAAHDRGIVHRHLKPANIKLRPDGVVKVLDFGLAKPGDSGVHRSPSSLTNSPTLTSPALLTGAGMILGTAAYMSPEQAKGKPADRRADMWAFGCVLFEMLTGTQTFPGEDVTEVLAAVVRGEPDWAALPKNTPPAIETLLRRCLRKDPKQRLADASAARLEIDDVLAGRTVSTAASALAAPARKSPLPLAAGVGLAMAAVAAILAWTLKPQPVAGPALSAQVEVGLVDGADFDESALNLAISPDGRTVAFISDADGVARLYLRPLDAREPTEVKGTDGAVNPFFSPDGRWIGFFAQGQMKKIPVAGGAPEKIADAAQSGGASWGDDGTIVFAPSAIAGTTGLARVSANGGDVTTLTTPDPSSGGEYSHRYPQVLPGSKAVLFTSLRGFGWNESNVEALSLATGERRVLVRGAHTSRYANGFLYYFRAGSVLAVPFDPDTLEVGTGAPLTVSDEVLQNAGVFSALYDVAPTGTVVYAPATGGSRQFERQLVWVDRQGHTEPLAAPTRNYFGEADIAPDGRRIALTIAAGTIELWIYDLDRGSLTRLTSDQSSSLTPLWSPDGTRLAYRTNRNGNWTVMVRPADGTGAEEAVTDGRHADVPTGWSPDGRRVVFSRLGDGADIWEAGVDGGHDARPLVSSPANDNNGTFSPDGRWLAYSSDETGGPQVYVVPYPGPGRRVQISSNGGDLPHWSHDGRELLYGASAGVMAVDVTASGASFSAGRPHLLLGFTGQLMTGTPDGQKGLATVGVVPDRPLTALKLMLGAAARPR